MLIVQGICLLLSHLPTSHTTVHAVPHTAVSRFLISRCVTSCFQPSLRISSLPFYCRIPSYRLSGKFLFGHLTTKDSQRWHSFTLHCAIQSFPIGTRALGTMTSADFSRFVVTACPYGLALETSPVMDVFFPSDTRLIYSESSEQLWDFVLFGRLIHSHKPWYQVSVRRVRCLPTASFRFHLAMDTLAFGCNLPTVRAAWGLAPVRIRSCWANQKKAIHDEWLFLRESKCYSKFWKLALMMVSTNLLYSPWLL